MNDAGPAAGHPADSAPGPAVKSMTDPPLLVPCNPMRASRGGDRRTHALLKVVEPLVGLEFCVAVRVGVEDCECVDDGLYCV